MLNPNLSVAWYLNGFQRISRGKPDDAIKRFARAMRLSLAGPGDGPHADRNGDGHLFAGRFDAASSWAEKTFRDMSGFLLAIGIIAASHALAGRLDEARYAMHQLRLLDPALRLSNLKNWVLRRRPEDHTTLADGLWRAELPE